MKYILILIIASTFSCKSNAPGSDMSGSETANAKAETIADSNMPMQEELPYFVNSSGDTIQKITKSDAEWARELGKQEFYVLREKGTERAFTGDLLRNTEKGVYTCGGCGLPLFGSETKFKSGTGWPSFYAPIDESHILEDTDYILGYARTEVMCKRCEGHLGHVFDDGPEPTGLRYCINSVSLDFEGK